MAYTVAADVKTYLGITGSGDDALITVLITRAQAIIDSYCRRTFEASADTTRTFDPTVDVDQRTLILDDDLCVITSVTNGNGATIVTGDYVTEPRNRTPWYALTIKSNATVYWTHTGSHEGSISIVGKWAYSTTAPADVVHAAIRLTAYLYHQKDNSNDSGGDVVVAGTVAKAVTLPADVKQTLVPYRRMVI